MTSQKFDFEACLKELEEITAKIENGDTTLDKSMELFEKGIKLSKECSRRLSDAKQKIIMLTEAETEVSENG